MSDSEDLLEVVRRADECMLRALDAGPGVGLPLSTRILLERARGYLAAVMEDLKR